MSKWWSVTSNWPDSEDEAHEIITDAANALARRNRDGSLNLDSVNLMIEKLLSAADRLNNFEEYEPWPTAPEPKPVLRLMPKNAS